MLGFLQLLGARDCFPVALDHNYFSANSKSRGVEDVIKIVMDMREIHPVGDKKVGNTVHSSTPTGVIVLHNLRRQHIKTLIRTAAKWTAFTVRILNYLKKIAKWTVFPISLLNHSIHLNIRRNYLFYIIFLKISSNYGLKE